MDLRLPMVKLENEIILYSLEFVCIVRQQLQHSLSCLFLAVSGTGDAELLIFKRLGIVACLGFILSAHGTLGFIKTDCS